MASYKLVLSRSFEKDVRKLPKETVARIVRETKALAEDPFPQGARKLKGEEGKYRLRVGDYRIIYTVDTELLEIDLIYARHRKDVYRNL